MRRTPGIIGLLSGALATLGLGAAGVGDVAVAGVQICHDQPATIVGMPGGEVHGTDGPDVVVTNGATEIDTGAGDDLVCVTGGSRKDDADVTVDDGDDVVDASASTVGTVRVRLGDGDDTYAGASGPDFVDASDFWLSPPDQGADTISTGAGFDTVVTGGTPRNPDHDAVDLGAGRDDAWLTGPVDAGLPILGGPGRDLLELDRVSMREALVVDNAAGQATAAGVPVMTWRSMERFRLTPFPRYESPSFVGGDGREDVWTAVPLTSVDLGGGDDKLNLELQDRLVDEASYRGGAGDDKFVLYAGGGDEARHVDLDLASGSLLFQREQHEVHASIQGFEWHKLSARRLDVRGTARADHVQLWGCHGEVAGGRGDDRLVTVTIGDAECGSVPERADLVVRGGPGDDALVGNYLPDTLLGGPGHDFANGEGGIDRCVAEKRVRCEL